MAETLNDAEFWLPSQFLTDDDIFMDVMKSSSKTDKKAGFGDGFASQTDFSKSLFSFEFPYGFGSSSGVASVISSPGDSVLGSSETESDEEELLTGLTSQFARSTLQEAFKNPDPVSISVGKHEVVSGSPQSTLSAVESGCLCGQGSSCGSPNFQSRVSPPATWNLLQAAAGEVAKMGINGGGYRLYQNRGLLGPPVKPSPVSVPLNKSNLDIEFYLKQSLSQKQLEAHQLQQLSQQVVLKQENSSVWGGQIKSSSRYPVPQTGTVQNRGRNNENIGCRNNRPLGLSSSAWPSLQQSQLQPQPQLQQNGLGMRAIFLGNHVTKRESTGTGVFLPRHIGNQTDSRRKQACSTVLVPARVAQALNLNLNEVYGQHQSSNRSNGRFNIESDITLRLRVNNGHTQQKPNYMRPQHHTQVVSHEIGLPQEWTY